MQRNTLVLTQLRDNSDYNDFIGRFYHFPNKYLSNFRELPAEFVYCEGHQDGAGTYYGYGKIIARPTKDKREVGHWFAEIVEYKPFLAPVPFKEQEVIQESPDHPITTPKTPFVKFRPKP